MNWLRSKQVADKLALSLSGLRDLATREESFPKPVRVSERHTVYDEAAIDTWMQARFDIYRGESTQHG